MRTSRKEPRTPNAYNNQMTTTTLMIVLIFESVGTSLSSSQSRTPTTTGVMLDEIVDPTLLAGFVVENDAIIIDGSLNGLLKAVRNPLLVP
jgi:ATP synthase delta (OSCP) subunit